jgi:hypothetical protein
MDAQAPSNGVPPSATCSLRDEDVCIANILHSLSLISTRQGPPRVSGQLGLRPNLGLVSSIIAPRAPGSAL